uniref:S2 n=1 Tax=Equine infectious anemia virus TaxID=11665 RepID=A0A411K850_9RETR|nr:S2 [Equine infectious anemia virus]
MGLFGKGVTWSALPFMGASRGEYQHLLSNNQTTHMMRTQYLNPITLIRIVTEKRKWQKEETQKIRAQDAKKIKC